MGGEVTYLPFSINEEVNIFLLICYNIIRLVK